MSDESHENATTHRPDANRIALRAIRAVLDAATSLSISVEGVPMKVEVDRLPAAHWPARGLEGLDEAVDGPLPRAVHARCTWPGGSTELLFAPAWWPRGSSYRDLTGIRTTVVATGQEIGWITVALRIRGHEDGETAQITAAFAPFKRGGENADEVMTRIAAPLQAAVERAKLPRPSPWYVEVFSVHLPNGDIEPSAEEGFRRLVHLALLKLPFFVRGDQGGFVGQLPFDIEKLTTATSTSITTKLPNAVEAHLGGVAVGPPSLADISIERAIAPTRGESGWRVSNQRGRRHSQGPRHTRPTACQ